MDRLKKYVVLLLALVLITGLATGLRSFLLVYVIEPVALLFWAAWRVVASVDQNVYWLVMIVVCAILVIRFIPPGREKSRNSAYNNTDERPNRVEYWRAAIEDAALGEKESENLRESLKELWLAVVAQTERSDKTTPEEILGKEKTSLSPEAQRYLFPPGVKNGMLSGNYRQNAGLPIPRWVRKWTRGFVHQDNTLIDEILGWIESDLEISTEVETSNGS